MKRLLAAVLVSFLLGSCATTPDKGIPVSNVVIDKSELHMVVGAENEKLFAYVLPFKATRGTILWSTSNSSVATVDPTGLVIAVAAGKATILATADGKSATCAVIVDPPSAKVTIDSIDQYFYSSLGIYDTYVTVFLTVTNTGKLPITKASIGTLATCADGSTYQGGGNVADLAPGSTIQVKTYIDVAAKQVKSVVVVSQNISYR
ncbi:MAG: Ig-like domain-containing protein [Spirochaetota bacterium]